MPAGAVLTIKAGLGAGGCDALYFALSDTFHIPVSFSIWSFAILVVAVTALIRRQFPRVTTFLTAVISGSATEFWKWIFQDVHSNQLISQMLIFAIGLLIISICVASYITCVFPANPTDDLIVALQEKGVRVRLSKVCLDIVCMIIAFVMGGEIGVGTIVCTFGLGLLVDFFQRVLIRGSKKHLHIELIPKTR